MLIYPQYLSVYNYSYYKPYSITTVAYIPGYIDLYTFLNEIFILNECVIGFELGIMALTVPMACMPCDGMLTTTFLPSLIRLRLSSDISADILRFVKSDSSSAGIPGIAISPTLIFIPTITPSLGAFIFK